MVERLKHLPLWGTYALLAYMPFHIFLSQSLSLVTGGLEAWKIAKDFLTIGLLIITGILVLGRPQLLKQRQNLLFLGFTVAYGLVHLGVYFINKDTSLGVALLASAYNNRLLWYLLIGMGSVLVISKKFRPDSRLVLKIVIIASTIVCLLGLAQWFLPKDILTHLGYGIERGVKPNFFINENLDFPRVMSTIRDPNSLGAFLIVPILVLTQLLLSSRKKMLAGGLLMLHGLVLLLSFSRAAWGGMIIAFGLLFILSHREKVFKLAKRYWFVVLGCVLLVGLAGYSIRSTQFVRSVVLRIDDTNPASQLDSDELHLFFIKEGAEGVAEKPMGYGPGTAGIVSIQNEGGSFLTENYYIQLAHEVGIIGLLIFLAIWGYTAKLLLKSRSVLAITLLASAGAYAVMAFVMHLWSNEAVAAQWWLLAGLSIGWTEINRVQKGRGKDIITPRLRTKRGN